MAEIPELSGCIADGETQEEALEHARTAIQDWISTARELNRAVPEPSARTEYSGKWLQRVPKQLHRDLVIRARLENVSLNALVSTVLAATVAASPANTFAAAKALHRDISG